MTLLRHTSKDVAQRKALTINPAKTCQPVGAMYAALGIKGCLPHSHGSQGCCAYHRSMLTRHFKEPVHAGTSSFTEGASVFGGQANLLAAFQNIFSVYDPEIIAVHTTCLSETIGDDLPQIIDKGKKDGKIPEGKEVIGASTPSYVGSHVTGFANMVQAMVKRLGVKTQPNGKVNVIPGYVEPADMAEIKRILKVMGVDSIMFPDTDGILNGPLTGTLEMFPDAGVTVDELRDTANSMATLALGDFASAEAGKTLDADYKVPLQILDTPIGIAATDRFVDALRKITGKAVPAEIVRERGQLLDVMKDYHQYTYHKKAAIAGDPDQVIALVEMLVSMDIIPAHIVSGTPGKRFVKRIKELTKDLPYEVNVMSGETADMFLLHQWMKNDPVDMLFCNTYGKYIARDEDIPLIRFGWPIVDRVGHQYFPTVGYKGSLHLATKIINTILDRQDRDATESKFELAL